MSRDKALLSIAMVISAGALLMAMPDARATAQRTFVASTGLDTNACSLTQPCRSFDRAITQTNVGGEIIVQDSAGYGSVTVTKSASIIAPAGIYGGISAFPGFDGVSVNAPGATVVLRGLSINGQGGNVGINLLQAARLRIESCVISNMGTRGISHSASGGEMIVLDTIVRDNLDIGIYVVAADGSALLDHVRSEHNQVDGFYIAPTPGSGGATATISNSVFTHNGLNGIRADTVGDATTAVQLERSIVSNNGGTGFRANAGGAGAVARVTLTRNAISANAGDGVFILGIPPGRATGLLSDNAVHQSGGNGISVDGDQANIRASGNTVQSNASSVLNADLICTPGSVFRSYGTNMAESSKSGAGCFTMTGGL